MSRYRIITLVDITRTNPDRSETDQFVLAQQANFNSLIQAIGLRANPDWVRDPVMRDGSLPHPLEGKANHWIWEFDVEREDVFLADNDPVRLFLDDIDGVPVIGELDNSVDFDPCVFCSKGDRQNIWVEMIS